MKVKTKEAKRVKKLALHAVSMIHFAINAKDLTTTSHLYMEYAMYAARRLVKTYPDMNDLETVGALVKLVSAYVHQTKGGGSTNEVVWVSSYKGTVDALIEIFNKSNQIPEDIL
jgi:methyl coenzyme M reductase subunit C